MDDDNLEPWISPRIKAILANPRWLARLPLAEQQELKRRQREGWDWHWVFGFDHAFDFAVWVLEMDGLKVPPFDLHDDRNTFLHESLREGGLDAAGWRTWVQRLSKMSRLRRYGQHPYEAWTGTAEIGVQLRLLYRSYVQPRGRSTSRERSEDCQVSIAGIVGRRGRQLDEALKPYHSLIPSPMRICLVNYPGLVQYTIPPRTLLVGARDWSPDADELCSLIVNSAEQLVNARRTLHEL